MSYISYNAKAQAKRERAARVARVVVTDAGPSLVVFGGVVFVIALAVFYVLGVF